MTESVAVTQPPKMRRGVRLYERNPFIEMAQASTKRGVKRLSDKTGMKALVVSNDTGEVIGPAGFWTTQEVDRTQFVKLYINGVKAFKGLTGAGTKVFELLFVEVQKQIGGDRVFLSYSEVDQHATPMSESVYTRGMRELIEKKFIAPSLTQGRFFINPDFMFNGDRLAFVQEYRLKPSIKAKAVDTLTMTLPGMEPPAPPALAMAADPQDPPAE